MQPTIPQTQTGTADMDLTAVQSMDWFFKKEQIYLLAQFWQQRATLAEKEVNTLKEQLSTNTTSTKTATNAEDQETDSTTITDEAKDSNNDNTPTIITTILPPNSKLLSPTILSNHNNNNNSNSNNNNNTKLLNSVAAAITLHQNGGNLLATTPSPSPPLSDSGACSNNLSSIITTGTAKTPLNGVNGGGPCLNPKLFFNHAQQMMMEAAAAAAAAAAAVQQPQQSPMHSPTIHTTHQPQAQPQSQHNDDEDDDLVTRHNNTAHHHHHHHHVEDEDDNDNDDGSICGGGKTTPTATTTATNIDAANKLITTLTAEFKLNKISDNSSRLHDNDNNNRVARKHKRTDIDEDNDNDDGDSDSDHVVDSSLVVGNSKLNLSKNHNNNNNNNNNCNVSSTNLNCTNDNDNATVVDDDNDEVQEQERTRVKCDDVNMAPNDDEDDANENNRCVVNMISKDSTRRFGNNHTELLAAKDKEIKALIDEVQRLRALEQTHIVQIQRLEEHLEAKRQHILRLEARLDKQQINDALTATERTTPKSIPTFTASVTTATTTTAAGATTTTTTIAAATGTGTGTTKSSELYKNKQNNNDEVVDSENVVNDEDDDDDDDVITINATEPSTTLDNETTQTKSNVSNINSAVVDADDDNDDDDNQYDDHNDNDIAADTECEKHADITNKCNPDIIDADVDTAATDDDDDVEEVVQIKKENQSPLNLDTLSQQQSALAAAAAAAAACANDPSKFQELLLERSKAFAAAEALKSTDATTTANETQTTLNIVDAITTTTTMLADNEKAETDILETGVAIIPKIEIPDENDDNVQENANENENENENLNESARMKPANDSTTTSMTTIDLVECETPNKSPQHVGEINQFHKNIENFGSLLGEELVNTYWRRGFDQTVPPTNLLMPPHSQVLQQQQQLQQIGNANANNLAQHAPLHHHHQQQQQQQAYQQHAYHQHHHAPSSTTLLSQLVNSTFSTQRSTASTAADITHHLHSSHFAATADQHDKSQGNHENSSTASTPNPHDQRSNDGHHISLNGSIKSHHEDNNNSLCVTPTPTMAGHHLPHGFLPGLPFQFQERATGHFRFADDLQLPPGASMAGRLGESLIPKGDPMEAKLQEMLRYNMDKYANQALDTLHISRRVRELLSVHNIGQRLFAKYILGLSQGTVSELLSKPKPWDKLTEKGRDSYRKMHAWACDDNAVMLLKSLIPKKDSGLPQYGGRQDDSMSDERIAHILNEASSIIKNTSTPNATLTQQQQQIKDEQQRRSVHEESHSNDDSKSPHPSCTSPFYKDQMKQQQQHHSDAQLQQQRLRQQEELTQDKMARLYQELMARAPRETPFPSFLLSPFFSAASGMPPNMTPNAFPAAAAAMAADENIRLAFEREMAKLQQQQHQQQAPFPNFTNLMALQQQMLNGAQDLSLGKDLKDIKINGQRISLEHCSNSMDSQSNSTASNNNNNNNSSKEHETSSAYGLHQRKHDSHTPAPPPPPPQSTSNASAQNVSNSTAPSPLSNSILPPAMTPNDDFSSAASPLQRMASITNSLITQPPVTPHHSQPQRPTKAVLPPITQQQFDMFNNLNTEDIVRRVKEALSQYSISQRLFGESVLGLSQGSVSDLLARPKPWHMLTQKGREPFIRMKMFLEDENAVHKLVASQYKIAPEKLMRTGSYSGSPQIPQGLASKMQASLPMQKMMSELKLQEPTQAQHIMQQMQAAAMSAAMQQQHQHQQQQAQSQQQQAAAAVQAAHAAAAAAAQQHHNMLLTSPGLPPQHAIQLPAATAPGSTGNSGNVSDKKPMMMPIHSPHQANAMRSMHQHMSPTVYEMAALTQDLDTQIITTKIKEALLANNIGQKIFGEAVLGLSQGSVSELLSKPKPWHMLSIKGREPFIRMQLWLSDANNVERLQVIKNERREASKRRRSIGPNQQDNSSDTSSNDTNDFYTSSPGPGSVGSAVSGAPPNKKQRVLFSEEQKEALRLAFALDPYPNVGTIEFLANELGLATRTITNWFHNHRMRLKQQVPHGPPGTENPIPTRESTNNTPFDPVQFRILLQQRLLELHKERMGLSGTPIPYPPYFAAAALLGRSLAGLPGATAGGATETDLQALNQAFKEQMSGLDLTMSSLKRERTDDFDDDMDESHMSSNESLEDGGEIEDKNGEFKETPRSALNKAAAFFARSSRRKPAAPQWVNPAGTIPGMPIHTPAIGDEHIINGVCVMQPQSAELSRHDDDGEDVGAAATDEHGSEEIDRTASDENEANDQQQLNIDQRLMEPEVQIKQEHDDESNHATDNAEEQAEKIKLINEEKLRMVRVRHLSQEDDGLPTTTTTTPIPPTWNYAAQNL